MKTIQGFWFPHASARRVAGEMHLSGDGVSLHVEGETDWSGAREALSVSQRVGSIPRRITLPGQWTFETADNAAVDQWLASAGSGLKDASWIHRLESRWRWILSALVVTVMVVAAGGYWGLPWVSAVAARHMPDSVVDAVSSGTLEILDDWLLGPSELPEARQLERQRGFEALVESTGTPGYRLHFRRLGMPNAFALPSGDIIVTDRFVELASAREFDAVMLHEIGHVRLRHGMQQLVRSSLVSFIIAMYLGDPSGVQELVVALPVFLLQSHYSRAHEREADEYAMRTMMASGIDPVHFASIMRKLAAFHGDGEPPPGEGGAEPKTSGDFLSSHPDSGERIRRALELSEEFRR